MTVLERFSLLITSPDDATFDQYDAPHLGHALVIVTAYALLSSFNSFLSAVFIAESFGFGLLAFMGAFLTTYLTWIFLTIIFFVAAELWGSLAEIVNAVAFVGMAAAPLILTSVGSILVTILGSLFISNDTDLILPKISLFISLIGMAWGWPGVLCYFGLKNATRIHPLKAIVITLIIFFAGALYEISYSNAF
ncbi:MAG TPA: YIP1 family protein [Bacteroidota bacterium]|nr:YIP1 family protein [Bacteroidota bacterium]